MRATTSSSTSSSPSRFDLGLPLLRLSTGAIFTVHGAQKLFVYGFGGVSGAFAGMHIPLPGITGPLVGLVEFFGGLALIAGLLTRLAGLGLAINMLGAIAFVHLAAGFFAPNGVEFPLSLLGASLTLAFAGAGRFSIDALIAGRRSASVTTGERPTLRQAA